MVVVRLELVVLGFTGVYKSEPNVLRPHLTGAAQKKLFHHVFDHFWFNKTILPGTLASHIGQSVAAFE